MILVIKKIANLTRRQKQFAFWGLDTALVSLPIKSSKIQTRASPVICSTVAMKFANGPECISTNWPASKSSRGVSLPTLSHRARRPVISASGMGLRRPAKLSILDMPWVELICLQGAFSGSQATNIYPANSGRITVSNLTAVRRVTSCIGRNVSNPCRSKLRTAILWLLGLNCTMYHRGVLAEVTCSQEPPSCAKFLFIIFDLR